MFKNITLFLFISVLSYSANAQFEIAEDTLYTYGFVKNGPSDFVDIPAEVKIKSLNGLSGELIKWVRTVNTLPDQDWSSAVCDIISCRGPEVDTGSFYFEAMDSGKLSFHFYPSEMKGDAQMTVKFYRADNPLDFVEVVTFISTWTPVSTADVRKANELSVYPNPSNGVFQFSGLSDVNSEFEVHTAQGVNLGTFNMESSTADLSFLNSGVYTLWISDAGTRKSVKLIKY